MPVTTSEKTIWWGTFSLESGQAGCWTVGPSTVWIYRLAREWRLVYCEDGDDPMSDAARVRVPLPEDEVDLSLDAIPDDHTVHRYSFHATEPALTIHPQLADRPVVVRPETPLYVPDGEAVTLYVSTALWLRVEAGGRLLENIPSHRPSDTWYGTTTQAGELCYATRTAGRLNLSDLPLRLHRAVTPVLIRNRANDPLLVERLQLPVQYLALFQAADDFLWTQPVRLEQERDGPLAALHVADGPPKEAEDARRIRDPQQTTRSNVIGRTFSTIFHKIREA